MNGNYDYFYFYDHIRTVYESSTIGENFQKVDTIVYDRFRSLVPTIVDDSSPEFFSSTKRRKFVNGSDMIVKIKIVLVAKSTIQGNFKLKQ